MIRSKFKLPLLAASLLVTFSGAAFAQGGTAAEPATITMVVIGAGLLVVGSKRRKRDDSVS